MALNVGLYVSPDQHVGMKVNAIEINRTKLTLGMIRLPLKFQQVLQQYLNLLIWYLGSYHKIFRFYILESFTAIFDYTLYCDISWNNSIQSKFLCRISTRLTLILPPSTQGLPILLSLLTLRIKFWMYFSFSQLSLRGWIFLIMSHAKCILRTFSFCNCLHSLVGVGMAQSV